MKRYIRYLYYCAAALFARIVQLMPLRLAVSCGGALGFLAYYIVADARRDVLDGLAASFPEWDGARLRRTAREVFINQGKNAFELFSFPRLSKDDILRLAPIENRPAFDAALSGGKGVLIAGAHCGNWEFMGASLAQAGYPINVIARRIYIEQLNDMLVGYRTSKGEKVILRSDAASAREMLRSLRHNESIGMLIDQDTDVPGVFVDFFGRKAWTPSGLATLALRTGAAVILALDVRMPDDTHRVQLSGPITLVSTGNTASDVWENTQRITAMIEAHIRRYPGQWVWMHRRWKTQEARA